MAKIEMIFSHPASDGTEHELGIDEEGKLYWDKKPVATKMQTSLDWWVNISAIIVACSSLIVAIYTVLDFYCKK